MAERIKERMRARGQVKDDGTPNVKAAVDAMNEAGLPVAYATMYDILRGATTRPAPATLSKVAAYYGVTVDWLIHGGDQRTGSFEQGAEFVLDVVRGALADAEQRLRERPGVSPSAPGEDERRKAQKRIAKLKREKDRLESERAARENGDAPSPERRDQAG